MDDVCGILKKLSAVPRDFYGRNLIFMAIADFDGGRRLRNPGRLRVGPTRQSWDIWPGVGCMANSSVFLIYPAQCDAGIYNASRGMYRAGEIDGPRGVRNSE